MAAVYTASNSKLFISENSVNQKSESTMSDFAATNWIQVKGLQTMGELGGEQTINEFEPPLDENWMLKAKGTRNGGTMTNVFIPIHNDPGQVKLREAIDDDCRPYQFKLERGADCAAESVVTISVATPGVVSWVGHGLEAGSPVIFSTTGALPTGLPAGTVYYVVSAGLTADAFSVAATVGGPAIATTAAGSGVHTATSAPAGMTSYFQAFATSGPSSGGGKADQYTITYPLGVNGRILTV